jgi:hypothetical protein
VSYRCRRPLAALAAIVYLSIPCTAQGNPIPILKGEVHSETPIDFHDYRVEMESMNQHGERYGADLRMDGGFELRNIPAGDYQLRVTTLPGEIVRQEFVSVNSMLSTVSVNLPPSQRASLKRSTISLTELRHPPDRKAIQSFAAAQKFAASGNPRRAAEELEKAVAISPEFADA